MHARLLTFTGNDRIDEVLFLWEATLVVLRAQQGFIGIAAGVDRQSNMVTVISLWTSESAMLASDGATLELREAAMVRSGAIMQVEHFEQVSEAFVKTPKPGSALMSTRLHVAPEAAEETLRYLESELLSGLLAQPGFCTMRTLFDRRTGRGLIGLTWDDETAMKAGEVALRAKVSGASGRGLHLDGSQRLELLHFEMA